MNSIEPKQFFMTPEMRAYSLAHTIMKTLVKIETYSEFNSVFKSLQHFASIAGEERLQETFKELSDAIGQVYLIDTTEASDEGLVGHFSRTLWEALTSYEAYLNKDLLVEYYLGFHVEPDDNLSKATRLAVAIKNTIEAYWDEEPLKFPSHLKEQAV